VKNSRSTLGTAAAREFWKGSRYFFRVEMNLGFGKTKRRSCLSFETILRMARRLRHRRGHLVWGRSLRVLVAVTSGFDLFPLHLLKDDDYFFWDAKIDKNLLYWFKNT
jgi:hypothetical protein